MNTISGSYATEFCSSRVSELDALADPQSARITLPGVNKPRGRGPARGSPLRLRLPLLRLCISSPRYHHPVRSHLRASTTIFFPFHLSLSPARPRAVILSRAPSPSLRDCIYEDRRHRWLVTRKLFSRENSSRRSAAIAIFSNLFPSHRASSTSNHATRQRPTETSEREKDIYIQHATPAKTQQNDCELSCTSSLLTAATKLLA